ncbi:MAG: PEP-CTERM sorting domain-containing protein [Nostoc sp.]
MIGFKSKLLNATLGVTAALPLAAAGLFTSAGSAQAYTGGFGYSAFLNSSNVVTTFSVSKTSVNFSPNPGAILLQNQTGDFASDITGSIKSFQTPLTSPSPFIDVAGKLLNLTTIDPAVLNTTGGLTTINLVFTGLFNDGSQATGNIVFDTYTPDAQRIYTDGGTINNASFSGLVVTTVPEPAALLGLGAVGGVMAMSRRRKSFVK